MLSSLRPSKNASKCASPSSPGSTPCDSGANSADQSDWSSSCTAKYVEGSVGMLREKKLGRVLNPMRNGVIVINLADGGSLSYYKVFAASAKTLKSFRCLEGMIHADEDDDSLPEGVPNPYESIFTRKRNNKRAELDVSILSQIERVLVYVSDKDFVKPPDAAYLKIPATVPWRFKTVKNYQNKTSCFQIIVPPLPDGSMDPRVKIMKYRDQVKKAMHIKTVVFDMEYNFVTACDNKEDEDDFQDSGYVFDDNGVMKFRFEKDEGSDTAAAEAQTNLMKAKNSQVFTFRCENAKELTVYARAAQKLDRMLVSKAHDMNINNMNMMMPKVNKRIRTAEGMEIAAQTALLDKTGNSTRNLVGRDVETIGEEEFKCYPLHAYPFSWMTQKELINEMARKSGTFHDLTEGSDDEIGTLRIEVLQCNGIPKMDRYSLSDAVVYIVCGSSAFVTDTIPNHLNPLFLPLSRRACILPIKSAYDQVHCGVFDYDGELEMDDFIGKVMIEIPRLQSGFIYDFTLPLRQTTRVYQRLKLGSIRLRVQLNWKFGERSALLSYLPKSGSEIAKRLKQHVHPVTVVCPDQKSFYNVCHTVYGLDIPGKYNTRVKMAVQREMKLMQRKAIYLAKNTLIDVARWKSPLLSAYIFGSWMYFVADGSLKYTPAFITSLVVILFLRNYVKFHVTSAIGSIYGHRSILELVGVLLFNRHDKTSSLSQIQRGTNRSLTEQLLILIFGYSDDTLAGGKRDCWKQEDHSEFPFSEGTRYPKMSIHEAMNAVALRPDAPTSEALLGSASVLNWDDDDDSDFSDGDFEDDKRAARTSSGNVMFKRIHDKMNISDNVRGTITKMKNRSIFDTDGSRSIDQSTNNSGVSQNKGVNIPEQDVNIRLKKTKSIQQEISEMHKKVHLYNLHMFDDRVFFDTDKDEAERVLRINDNKNPVMKKLAPYLAGFIKIAEVELSASRAVFNLFMWKDPMLSFWGLLFSTFVMGVLLIFPWRLFFFMIGLVGLGPQNWIIAVYKDWKEEKEKNTPHITIIRSAQTQKMEKSYNESISELDAKSRSESSSSLTAKSRCDSNSELKKLSKSPLLFRNNTQMKADGKSRQVIVPAIPFRSNRFYDWPPEPGMTSINQG